MISGKNLKKWGVPHGPVFGVALKVFNDIGLTAGEAKSIIGDIISSPSSHLEGPYSAIASLLIDNERDKIRLRDRACHLKIYGREMIDEKAIHQMYEICKTPIAVRGALMPDAHYGYSMPIGGVLATDNVVIPYAVGVDIGCRMHMSVTDIQAKDMEGMRDKMRNILVSNTFFNAGVEQDGKNDDPLFDDDRWNIPALMALRPKAQRQLGTSGGGNHFVEYGIVELEGVMGSWLAILSHSGSRGFGSDTAKHYTKIAMDKCKLQKNAKHLAWLSLDDEDGQEYWEAMNLAGDYAQACHRIIHRRILHDLDCDLMYGYENHHNFAWKGKARIGCTDQYRDVIIHRKGATPADKGVTGIIPGSMSTNTYIVEGLGNEDSLCSSSHGAGRLMSRKQAKETLTMSDMKKDLSDKGIELIGGSLDECTAAYKDIDSVMREQADLVRIKGTFKPWMVRMAGEQLKPWEKSE